MVDTVSTEYEDAMCLETLGDLAKDHQMAEPQGMKCLIIAQVQTWDPRQPGKVRSSYNSLSILTIMHFFLISFYSRPKK